MLQSFPWNWQTPATQTAQRGLRDASAVRRAIGGGSREGGRAGCAGRVRRVCDANRHLTQMRSPEEPVR